MSFLMQHKLVSVLAVLLVVAGVWYGLSASSAPAPILTTDGGTDGSVTTSSQDQDIVGTLLTLRAVTLKGTIFQDPAYRTLQDYSTTIVPEPVGKQNPFDPLTSPASSSASASHQAQIFAPKK